MTLLEQLQDAVRFIQARDPLAPRIGLVLGSGLGTFAQGLDRRHAIPYAEIPHFPQTTAIGHQGELVFGTLHGISLAALSGRIHHYEGYRLEEVVFPIRVLGRLGARILIVTNAAGAINISFKPGELMIIEDHINLTGSNPLIGANQEALGPRFPDMTEAYDPDLREIAERACWKTGVAVRKGVYLGVSGPSYETPAEIRMARAMGADAVGMSTVAEVIAARHMGIRVLGISCLTNMAAGVSRKKLDHREVLDTGETARSAIAEVLTRIIVEAARLP